MANGDAAALQGFAPVAPGEDFRLGYDGINRAADFAASRIRTYSVGSTAAMNALTGMKRGDFCYRTDTGLTWKYETGWRAWVGDGTALMTYTGAVQPLSGRTMSITREGLHGLLNVALTFGAGGSAADAQLATIPADYRPAEETEGVVGVFNGNGSNAWSGFCVVALMPSGAVVNKYTTGGNGAGGQLLGAVPFRAI